MADIQLTAITRTYGTFVALDGISLSLAAGELVSLLGPSGCGKTTALRILAGFDTPTAGTITIGGKDVTKLTPSRRGVGMVFQAYSLFPTMTAQRNVEFGLRVRGVKTPRRRKLAQELLDLVGLGHAAQRFPHQLSGGMQQRVALARALAIQPRVLLLDEPLSALDAKVRVQLRDEIRRLQTSLGITTLYVTHDQEEALSVSDRVAVMRDGRIEQIGPPAEIYGEPATPFVAEFIGTINRIESQIGSDGTVVAGDTTLTLPAARDHAPGDRVIVLVRPETVAVGESVNGHGVRLDATVITSTFLGATTRVRLATPAGDITADMPSAGNGTPLPGTTIPVGFDPTSARILAVDPATN